jgi:hypothetical protein
VGGMPGRFITLPEHADFEHEKVVVATAGYALVALTPPRSAATRVGAGTRGGKATVSRRSASGSARSSWAATPSCGPVFARGTAAPASTTQEAAPTFVSAPGAAATAL